jgi:hypothetical protein
MFWIQVKLEITIFKYRKGENSVKDDENKKRRILKIIKQEHVENQ